MGQYVNARGKNKQGLFENRFFKITGSTFLMKKNASRLDKTHLRSKHIEQFDPEKGRGMRPAFGGKKKM
jgi:hypothetical protein